MNVEIWASAAAALIFTIATVVVDKISSKRSAASEVPT